MAQTPSSGPQSIPAVTFDFPPLPKTLAEILKILSQPTAEPDNERLIEFVRRDPATTLYVIRRINSSYYSLPRRITEIKQAVTFLGFTEVCNLVLTAGLRQVFFYLEETNTRDIFQHLTLTSIAAAAFAKNLAVHLQLLLPETAYTAGLLHQLGRMVFLHRAPKKYEPLWLRGTSPSGTVVFVAPLIQQEQALFGTHYVDVGAAIAKNWCLPDELIALIGAHLSPERIADSGLRALAFTVAIGGATSQDLFKPERSGEDADQESDSVPALLAQLASNQKVRTEDLVWVLDEWREVVRQFAWAALHD